MKALLFSACLALCGCANHVPVQSFVTPFVPHVSRSNAEIIARYQKARENGFSHGSAYQYARGDRTYTDEQLDVIGLTEMLGSVQLV